VWLLLCTSDDHAALWAAHGLRARRLSPLVVLTPELLQFSFRWQHRLTSEDLPSVEFTLADGRAIRGAEIRGVLNRIPGLSPHLVRHLTPADQTYALQEWTALHISWLSALKVPVLNRPVMQGFCGAWRHESEWIWLAARAGLRTASFRQQGAFEIPPLPVPSNIHRQETQTVFVVDGRVVGAGLSEEMAAACASVGRLSDTPMVGIDLDPARDEFVSASPRPDLRLGGEPLLDALHGALAGNV
jgi:hypothetical protein